MGKNIEKLLLFLVFFAFAFLSVNAKEVKEEEGTVKVKLLSSSRLVVPEAWKQARDAYDGTTSTWSTNNNNAVMFAWEHRDFCDIRLLNPAMYATEPIEVYYDFTYFPNAVLTNVRLIWKIEIDTSGMIYSLSPSFYTSTIALGNQGSVEIDVNASEDADKTVVFTSSDTTIVKVVPTGKTEAQMYGIGVGKAKITASAAARPAIKYTFEVKVTAPKLGDTFDLDGITYQVTDTKNKECRVGVLRDYGSFSEWERAIRQSFAGKITIPQTVYGYSVTSIGEWAFRNCESINEVIIPDLVTNIGFGAFSGCSGLKSVALPSKLKHIGAASFQYCTSLTTLSMPSSVESIGNSAFSDCTSLSNIKFSENITSVEAFAFENTLWYDNLPDGIVYIGKVAYTHKGPLPKYLSIKEGIVSIPSRAFYYSDGQNLRFIKLPSSLSSIGEEALANGIGWSLRGIQILNPDPIDIKDDVFGGINIKNFILYVPLGTSMKYKNKEVWKNFKEFIESDEDVLFSESDTEGELYTYIRTGGVTCELSDASDVSGSIVIPTTAKNYEVTGVGIRAFFKNKRISGVTLNEGISYIGMEAFSGCTALTSVQLPTSINTIGLWSFERTGIDQLTIPDNVRDIGYEAFINNDNLKSVIIGKGVEVIGNNILNGCPNFEIIYSRIEYPSNLSEWAFFSEKYEQCFKTVTLYVPKGTIERYQSAIGWNKFTHIEEFDVEDDSSHGGNGDVNGDGEVNGTDLVALTNMILGRSEKKTAADVNGDGQVNGTDYVTLVNVVLGKK